MDSIDQLKELFVDTGQYDFALAFCKKTNVFDDLDSIRLWELYQRLRAGQVIAKFIVPLFEHKLNVCTAVTINSKKATMDFALQVGSHRIGVQVENDTLRRFINGNMAETFATRLAENGHIFDKEWRSPRGGRPFLFYGRGTRTEFVYQYRKIKEGTSVDKLLRDVAEALTEVDRCAPVLRDLFGK